MARQVPASAHPTWDHPSERGEAAWEAVAHRVRAGKGHEAGQELP